MTALTLDKIEVYYESDPPIPPGVQKVTLARCEDNPKNAAEVLRFLADQLDNGILRAGIEYRVTLVLYGNDDNPVFVGER